MKLCIKFRKSDDLMMPKCKEKTRITINEATQEENAINGRSLRKKRVNLNRLASSFACPLICQFQHCGIQLADGDTLEVRNAEKFRENSKIL